MRTWKIIEQILLLHKISMPKVTSNGLFLPLGTSPSLSSNLGDFILKCFLKP